MNNLQFNGKKLRLSFSISKKQFLVNSIGEAYCELTELFDGLKLDCRVKIKHFNDFDFSYNHKNRLVIQHHRENKESAKIAFYFDLDSFTPSSDGVNSVFYTGNDDVIEYSVKVLELQAGFVNRQVEKYKIHKAKVAREKEKKRIKKARKLEEKMIKEAIKIKEKRKYARDKWIIEHPYQGGAFSPK